MKPFWRTFWASSLSSLMIGLALFLFILSIVIGLASSFDRKPFKVEKNAILHLKLDESISEVSYAYFNPNSPGLITKQFGLNELKRGLKEAVNDENMSDNADISLDEVSESENQQEISEETISEDNDPSNS